MGKGLSWRFAGAAGKRFCKAIQPMTVLQKDQIQSSPANVSLPSFLPRQTYVDPSLEIIFHAHKVPLLFILKLVKAV